MKKRTDNLGRLLGRNEYQKNDGRYVFRYHNLAGETKYTYSWRLMDTDELPEGKRTCKSLREKEEKYIYERMNALDHKGGNMTVLELVKRYVSIQSKDKRETTCKGYRTQLNFMQENAFARKMSMA